MLDAPAGWGKTSLLAEWCAGAHDARVAWVALDPGDDHPVLFWSYVLAALQRSLPGIGNRALRALPAGGRALRDAALPSLVNDLVAEPGPIVLVLDDYHVITDRSVHETVTLLVERMPEHVHVVVATRGRPEVVATTTTAAPATASAAALVATGAAAAFAATAEELDVVGDDLGHVLLLTRGLVVPRAGLQPPLDVAGAPLVEVLRAVLRGLAPHHHAVPLGALLLLVLLVGVALVGGEPHLAHRLPRRQILELGLGAEIADQDDLVHAARHYSLL